MDYNSIFEIIEDECLDILQNSNYGKRESATFTADTTIKLVMKELRAPVNKRSRKKISKKILIIAIAATLLFSTAVCGNSYWKIWREGGAERITNDNRDIVGKEVIHSGYYPEHPNDRKDIPPTSLSPNEIVKTAEEGAHIPLSMDIFTTTQDKDTFITPEIIAANNAMAIFTTPDKKGWKLEKGDILNFEVLLYPCEIIANQHSAFMYILNGELKEELTGFHQKDIKYQLCAKEDGYYHIAFIGASSETTSLHEGKIYITKSKGSSNLP
ncbi:hypothetical protein ABXS75_13030 [Roseburia hominis]